MNTITMTIGLPGSGKTFEAEKLIASSDGKIIGITKDKIREMVLANHWTPEKEKIVIETRETLIDMALNMGKDVILHDTNFGTHIERIKQKFGHRAHVKVWDFRHVPLQVCIDRNAKRSGKARVPNEALAKMWNNYVRKEGEPLLKVEDIKVSPIKPHPVDLSLPDCFIFDIDGTLAVMGSRKPFEWHKVGEDSINPYVVAIYNRLFFSHTNPTTRFFIFSGRDSVCREETSKWLSSVAAIKHDGLFMRPEGDNRKDSIIKQELFDEHIKGKYNVLGIFDDRLQVCRMWHELGLPLFRVGDPDADF